MQTFLPYEAFEQTALALDKRRLNKQRIEAWQIFQAITNPNYGWQHHPAVNMWRGHEGWLLQYGHTMCVQWRKVGGKDNVGLEARFWRELGKHGYTIQLQNKPKWLGDEAFHLSHRSNLVRKDPVHYRQFFPEVPDNLPYLWPVKSTQIDQIKERIGYHVEHFVSAGNLHGCKTTY